MVIRPLEDLLIYELQDLYDAKLRLVRALPKVVNAAALLELKWAFADQLIHNEEHVRQLERTFSALGETTRRGLSEDVQDCLEAVEQVIAQGMDGMVMDAALIEAVQRVEEAEMVVYETVQNYAQQLEYREVDDLIGGMIAEEIQVNARLSQIADIFGINRKM